MSLFQQWQRVPRIVRLPVSRALRRTNFLPWLHRVAGHPAVEGFKTETPDTLPAIEKAMRRVVESRIPGDYYEFGLYRGYTFWHAQQTAKRVGVDQMQFWGFDSFAGLPELKGVDAETQEFKTGDYTCSRRQVESHLNRYGVDWSKTHLVEGFYHESLRPKLIAEAGMRPAAVVLIDCDLYCSTVCALGFLEGLLQAGTVILFDDYNCFGSSDERGERRAFREFLVVHPTWKPIPFLSFGWHGQAFVLER